MALINRSQSFPESTPPWRAVVLLGCIIVLFVIILARLFYWQIVRGAELAQEASKQYQRQQVAIGERGKLFFADGQPLVTNQTRFRLIAQPHLYSTNPLDITNTLLGALTTDPFVTEEFSTESNTINANELKIKLLERMDQPDRRWVTILNTISQSTRDAIASLNIAGITFESYQVRTYPEASMAAHLTGFVGKNDDGGDQGYFGLEGALEHELQGRQLKTTVLADAFGRQLSAEQVLQASSLHGRDVTLTIQRDLQYLAERSLAEAMQRYQVLAGEIIILDPKTGDILALATSPSYDQARYNQYPASQYTNPSLSSLYEPGSTLKILTVAAGIDAGVIKPDTQCPSCAGPRKFGRYTIKTWNDQYNPNITMSQALAKSDNTAMIYVAEQVGAERMREYLENFGMGARLNIDLQGDRDTPFPKRWGPVELATISFGQGISTSSLQLMRAVATIANDGVMMRPRIVKSTTDPQTGEEKRIEPIDERRVISAESAKTVTEMMVEAAQTGEAQWVQSPTYTVAGKTGTSQVAAEGGYDETKTVASYIGFAPPEQARFVLLVKLVEPGTSPWAAETAAPVWYAVARELFLALHIIPDRVPKTDGGGV